MTDIERHEPATTPDVPATWVAAMRLTARICDTAFVPKGMRGDPATTLACILYGEEIGLGPMQSLNSIHVIEGRPAASPELMRALVARQGHTFSVDKATTDAVTVSGKRKDTGATATVTWTMEDARRAGLSNKQVWKSYPRAMLLARATSELCRALFADCVKGLSYTPEEAASIEGAAWAPDMPLIDPITDAPAIPAAASVPGPEPEWDGDDPNDPLETPTLLNGEAT
jgi:hypothetical protein